MVYYLERLRELWWHVDFMNCSSSPIYANAGAVSWPPPHNLPKKSLPLFTGEQNALHIKRQADDIADAKLHSPRVTSQMHPRCRRHKEVHQQVTFG